MNNRITARTTTTMHDDDDDKYCTYVQRIQGLTHTDADADARAR